MERKALSFYGKGHKDVKFDEGLVTDAELQLREFFQDQLFARFPDHKVYKTDRGEDGYTHGGKRYLWIYDPLDGVANFQAGIPVWGTSVALFENYWPVFGIFHLPVTGDLFHAQAGHKAMWGQKQIRVSSQEEINDESLLLTYSRFHQRYQCSFPGKIRSLGCTGAHICYVAMGRAEAAVLGSESYKDLAAAAVILEAAGGKIYRSGRKGVLSERIYGRGEDRRPSPRRGSGQARRGSRVLAGELLIPLGSLGGLLHTGQPCIPRGFSRWLSARRASFSNISEGGAVGRDPAVIDHDGALAQIDNHVQIMGGDDLGVLECSQKFDEFSPRLWIQVGGRFVHDQDIGRHGQDRGNSNGSFLSP